MSGWDLEITIDEIKGNCAFGHQVGEKIYYDGYTFKGKICPTALTAMMSTIYAFCFGAEFPWDKEKDVTGFSCPDRKNCVHFKIKRLRNKPWTKGLLPKGM